MEIGLDGRHLQVAVRGAMCSLDWFHDLQLAARQLGVHGFERRDIGRGRSWRNSLCEESQVEKARVQGGASQLRLTCSSRGAVNLSRGKARLTLSEQYINAGQLARHTGPTKRSLTAEFLLFFRLRAAAYL